MIEELKKLLSEYPKDSEEYRILAEAINNFQEYLMDEDAKSDN